MDQRNTPLFDALEKYVKDKTIPFQTPGHKEGRAIHDRMK